MASHEQKAQKKSTVTPGKIPPIQNLNAVTLKQGQAGKSTRAIPKTTKGPHDDQDKITIGGSKLRTNNFAPAQLRKGAPPRLKMPGSSHDAVKPNVPLLLDKTELELSPFQSRTRLTQKQYKAEDVTLGTRNDKAHELDDPKKKSKCVVPSSDDNSQNRVKNIVKSLEAFRTKTTSALLIKETNEGNKVIPNSLECERKHRNDNKCAAGDFIRDERRNLETKTKQPENLGDENEIVKLRAQMRSSIRAKGPEQIDRSNLKLNLPLTLPSHSGDENSELIHQDEREQNVWSSSESDGDDYENMIKRIKEYKRKEDTTAASENKGLSKEFLAQFGPTINLNKAKKSLNTSRVPVAYKSEIKSTKTRTKTRENSSTKTQPKKCSSEKKLDDSLSKGSLGSKRNVSEIRKKPQQSNTERKPKKKTSSKCYTNGEMRTIIASSAINRAKEQKKIEVENKAMNIRIKAIQDGHRRQKFTFW